ncbi:Translation initiation factor 3 subunit J component [Ascosphaera pollenicola]|nr:Translation initiation factor 3 subunit J component [Ascosphaera pollenicola]
MAPPKWDDEEVEETPAFVSRRRFEDEEEDVLEDWEEAEDSEVEREKEKKAAEAKAKADAEAAANKKSKAQRMAEQKEARAKEAAEKAAAEAAEATEDPAEKRERLRRQQIEADLKHAEDLFGDLDVKTDKSGRTASKPTVIPIGNSSDPTATVDLSELPLFKPTTKAQFETLTQTLVPMLTAQSKKPQFAIWAPEFCKALVKELSSTDIKKVTSALTAAANEKLKEEKAADRGGKKSKAAKTKTTLNVSGGGRGGVGLAKDTTAYEEAEDDYGMADDDFM